MFKTSINSKEDAPKIDLPEENTWEEVNKLLLSAKDDIHELILRYEAREARKVSKTNQKEE